MKLYITHQSANNYWHSPYAVRKTSNEWQPSLPSEPLAGLFLDPENLTRLGAGDLPLHLAVAESRQRSQRSSVVNHIFPQTLLKGSFQQIARDTWVATPELCFCQMAETLPLRELVYLGYEFCATYNLADPYFTNPFDSDSLSSVQTLRDFCARFEGRKGHRAAAQALRYIAEGAAASPMEISVAMLLTLPQQYGGYGLPACRLNLPLEHDVPKPRRGDLVWPERRVVVEYDSNLAHTGSEKIARDAVRRNALQDAGWTMITLTWNQIARPAECDNFVNQLSRALKFRTRYTPTDMLKNRADLRRYLLPQTL